MRPIVFGLRDTLGFTLMLAGGWKVGRREALASIVRDYHVLPAALVRPAALVVPWIEVGVGSLLVAGFLMVPMALAAALLFSAFAVAMAINLARGRRIECGCFGAGGAIIGWWAVLRTALLAAAAATVAAIAPSVGPGEEGGMAIAVGIVAIVIVGVVRTLAEGRRLVRAERALLHLIS